jgi:hypothetical protein
MTILVTLQAQLIVGEEQVIKPGTGGDAGGRI